MMKHKPLKIAVVGTHGCGKSTLVFKLAAHYKTQGFNVKIIQEVARNCPFPINEKSTIETNLWIYHEHCKQEIEASRDHEVVISDRSAYDSFIYAKFFKMDVPESLKASAHFKLEYGYDKVIYVRPDMPLMTDGVRSPDLSFQEGVDELFHDCFMSMLNQVPVDVMSSDIFSKEERWKLSCL